MKMRFSLTILLPIFAFVCYGQTSPSPTRPTVPSSVPSAPLHACHGEKKPLTITRQMPYLLTQVGTAKGYFLIDFGTNQSSIDTSNFLDEVKPQPEEGTTDKFAGFEFYGGWAPVTLLPRTYNIQGISVQQAGIIGTDFLGWKAFTVDYREGALYRAESTSFCSDDVLRKEGFVPVTAKGYYHADLTQLGPDVIRVPTVPIRIGKVTAVAQLDTGFDDSVFPHSININRAYFKALTAAGVKLKKISDGLQLSTCVTNVSEKVIPHRITSGQSFEIIATDGSVALATSDTVIHLKDTPAAARKCLGIGTWDTPAAQVAASFFVDAGRMVFDPFKAQVWFGRKTN